MTARVVDEWCGKAPATPRKWWLTVWSVIAGVLVLAFIVNTSGLLIKLGQAIRAGKIPFLTDHDGMSLAMFSEYLRERTGILLAAFAAVLILIFAAGINMEKRRYRRVFGIVAAVVLGGFLAYHLGIEPGTDRMKTDKRPFAETARTLVGRTDKLVYLDDFNTELIYFMDHDEYRHVAMETDKTDRKRKRKLLTPEYYAKQFTAEDRWVIAPPDVAEKLHAAAPGVWQEKLRTIDDHQYPAVLLERRAAGEKQDTKEL